MNSNKNIPWQRLSLEATAIVMSILLAFAIDAWWDGRKEAEQRQRLLSALIVDFETTRERALAGIDIAERAIERTRTYLNTDPTDESKTIRELWQNFQGAFEKIEFEPALSGYRGAVDTGQISLLRSAELGQAIAEITQTFDNYDQHDRITAELVFLDAMYDASRMVGLPLWRTFDELRVARFRKEDQELREILANPTVAISADIMLLAYINILDGLTRTVAAAERVLAELKRLQELER